MSASHNMAMEKRSISIREDLVKAKDQQLIAALGFEFTDHRIPKWGTGGGAGAINGLVIFLGVVAASFLQEMGADVYRSLKDLVVRKYHLIRLRRRRCDRTSGVYLHRSLLYRGKEVLCIFAVAYYLRGRKIRDQIDAVVRITDDDLRNQIDAAAPGFSGHPDFNDFESVKLHRFEFDKKKGSWIYGFPVA